MPDYTGGFPLAVISHVRVAPQTMRVPQDTNGSQLLVLTILSLSLSADSGGGGGKCSHEVPLLAQYSPVSCFTQIRVPSGLSVPIRGKDVIVDFQKQASSNSMSVLPETYHRALEISLLVSLILFSFFMQRIKVGVKGHPPIIDGELYNKVLLGFLLQLLLVQTITAV